MKRGPRRSSAYISIMNVRTTTPKAVSTYASVTVIDQLRPEAPRPRVHAEGAPAWSASRPSSLRFSGGGAEALGDLAPVDDVPPRVDVVRASVLILQVVGVLPHVDAQERRLAI